MKSTSQEKFSRYYKAIHYLEGLNNISGSYQKINLSSHRNPVMYLERMQDLLDSIGNPEKGFKYVHITGTAGKGSVSSMVHATLVKKLEKRKEKIGLFTSPFVTSTIEKIQVDKKYIDPNIFADIVEYLKPHIDKQTISGRHEMPSYFEIIFAIALLYFKKEKCKYVVLEVGLGGSYDATNIIKSPVVTAITNIDLDHTQVLGTTKESIAQDKAGIIKKGSHFFTTENDKELLTIFRNKCNEKNVSYTFCNVERLNYSEKNKLLAGSICLHLGIIKNISDITIPEYLPARFEIVEKNPLVIIDGAHNPSKILSTVFNLHKLKYHRLNMVISISTDKDWGKILDIILPEVGELYVTRFSVSGRTCVDPKEIVRTAKNYLPHKKIHYYSDPLLAFEKARKTLNRKDALLITGSFYLAGDIRALYCPEDTILKQRNSNFDRKIF